MEKYSKRDYAKMRKVLGTVAKATRPLDLAAFGFGDLSDLAPELKRLVKDGLIESTVEFDAFGEYVCGEVVGLTEEGKDFFSLVAKGDVWALVQKTLDAAGIDVPYPLLKEVCEEVVKRYVTSFIPEITRRCD